MGKQKYLVIILLGLLAYLCLASDQDKQNDDFDLNKLAPDAIIKVKVYSDYTFGIEIVDKPGQAPPDADSTGSPTNNPVDPASLTSQPDASDTDKGPASESDRASPGDGPNDQPQTVTGGSNKNSSASNSRKPKKIVKVVPYFFKKNSVRSQIDEELKPLKEFEKYYHQDDYIHAVESFEKMDWYLQYSCIIEPFGLEFVEELYIKANDLEEGVAYFQQLFSHYEIHPDDIHLILADLYLFSCTKSQNSIEQYGYLALVRKEIQSINKPQENTIMELRISFYDDKCRIIDISIVDLEKFKHRILNSRNYRERTEVAQCLYQNQIGSDEKVYLLALADEFYGAILQETTDESSLQIYQQQRAEIQIRIAPEKGGQK